MSALSNIPRHAVLPLGAYDKNGLVRAALQTDQTLLQCDCAAAHDKASVLAALGEGLKEVGPRLITGGKRLKV